MKQARNNISFHHHACIVRELSFLKYKTFEMFQKSLLFGKKCADERRPFWIKAIHSSLELNDAVGGYSYISKDRDDRGIF